MVFLFPNFIIFFIFYQKRHSFSLMKISSKYTHFWKWYDNFLNICIANKIFKILFTKTDLIRCYFFMIFIINFISILSIEIGLSYWWNLCFLFSASSNFIFFYWFLSVVLKFFDFTIFFLFKSTFSSDFVYTLWNIFKYISKIFYNFSLSCLN